MNLKQNHYSRRALALLLTLVMCVGMIPTAFAAQQNSYHDPPSTGWSMTLMFLEQWDAVRNSSDDLSKYRPVVRSFGWICSAPIATHLWMMNT